MWFRFKAEWHWYPDTSHLNVFACGAKSDKHLMSQTGFYRRESPDQEQTCFACLVKIVAYMQKQTLDPLMAKT